MTKDVFHHLHKFQTEHPVHYISAIYNQ